MGPKHLQKAGDSGFVSIKFNLLPALRRKEPRVFERFCYHIEEALQHLNEEMLNLGETSFLEKDVAIQILAEKSGLSGLSKHPFLTGCLKIVRKG